MLIPIRHGVRVFYVLCLYGNLQWIYMVWWFGSEVCGFLILVLILSEQ